MSAQGTPSPRVSIIALPKSSPSKPAMTNPTAPDGMPPVDVAKTEPDRENPDTGPRPDNPRERPSGPARYRTSSANALNACQPGERKQRESPRLQIGGWPRQRAGERRSGRDEQDGDDRSGHGLGQARRARRRPDGALSLPTATRASRPRYPSAASTGTIASAPRASRPSNSPRIPITLFA
jgi:hypothetical protein